MRQRPNPSAILAAAALVAALGACTTSRSVLVGQARPATTPDQVRIYLQAPASKYQQIADVYASSRGSWAMSASAKIDKVVERLKIEAAKLGANGVLLHGVGAQGSGSIGAGISNESSTTHSPYIMGLGGSMFLHHESGDGVAIYVESN